MKIRYGQTSGSLSAPPKKYRQQYRQLSKNTAKYRQQYRQQNKIPPTILPNRRKNRSNTNTRRPIQNPIRPRPSLDITKIVSSLITRRGSSDSVLSPLTCRCGAVSAVGRPGFFVSVGQASLVPGVGLRGRRVPVGFPAPTGQGSENLSACRRQSAGDPRALGGSPAAIYQNANTPVTSPAPIYQVSAIP